MAALIVVNPIVYATVGRSASVSALSPLAAIAALFTLCRTWINLGPNQYTKLGGILFFVLAMLGVAMLAVYNALDAEWVHALIGGSFIASTIPLSVAFWNAQLLEDGNEDGGDDSEGDQQNVNEMLTC